MPAVSCSGCLYSMNVIDNFSGYVWSLPLKLKSEAADILRGWHHAVENQTNHKLKILVTDNGELISKSMEEWSTEFGIDHQRTAPYTSAQNGRAERLHRTILSHARAMRLPLYGMSSAPWPPISPISLGLLPSKEKLHMNSGLVTLPPCDTYVRLGVAHSLLSKPITPKYIIGRHCAP